MTKSNNGLRDTAVYEIPGSRRGIQKQRDVSADISAAEKMFRAVIIFVIVISLGFPGKYTRLLGGGSEKLFEYSAFILQIAVMLLSGAVDGVSGIRLIDLKRRYGIVYFTAAVFFIDSMLVTAYPSEQFISCFRFTVTIFFALWLADRYEACELLRLICTAQLIFVVLTLMYAAAFPGAVFVREQGDHDFAGIMATKNNAAAEFAFGRLMFIAWFKMMRRSKKSIPGIYIIGFVISAVMLLLCNAKGAIICFLLPAAYLIFFEGRSGERFRLPLGLIYVAGSVGFIIIALTILPLFKPLLDLLGKDVTLTGRTILWRQIINVMTDGNTFTGYGFGMFWRNREAVAMIHAVFRQNSFFGMMSTGAHNVILEYWLNVGLIGVGCYFAAFLISFSHPEQISGDDYMICAAYILWFMMHGLTERSMSTYEYQTLFLFAAMGLGCNRPYKAVKHTRRKILIQ